MLSKFFWQLRPQINIILVSFFAVFFCPFIEAQQYFFKNYSLEQGLIQSQVSDIKQDQDGFLWFSTNGGLSRFDGKNFINYSILDGLPDNQINTITCDQNGRVWVGSLGSICLFDRDTFIQYPFPHTWSDAYVLDVFQRNSYEFLIGTDKSGILIFNFKTKNFQFLKGSEHIELVRDLYQDSRQQLWVSSKSGLFLMNKSGQWRQIQLHSVEYLKPSSVIEDTSQNYWISTYGNGLFLMTKNDTIRFSEQEGLVNNSIRRIYKSSDQKLWFLSKSGISVFDQKYISKRGQNRIKKNYFTNYTSRNGLPNPSVEAIYEDTEKNIWIGTDGQGIFRFNGPAVVRYFERDGMCSDLVMSFANHPNGDLMFGTYNHGLCSSGVFPKSLQNITIWDIFVSKHTGIWLATSDGLSHIQNSNIKTFNQTHEFPYRRVNCVKEDVYGHIWIGLRQGLVKFDGIKFHSFFNDSISLGERIRSISIYKDHVWAGSNRGLIHIKNDKQAVIPLPVEDQKKEINSVLADSSVVWIGTTNGLFIYDITQKSFQKIWFSVNYTCNIINSLVKDDQNNVWVGTNFGIFRIYSLNKNTYAYHFLNQEDGLPSLECNQNAAFKDNEGYLWFGTAEGVCKIDPKLYTHHVYQKPPKLVVLDVRLFMQKTDWRNYSDDHHSAFTSIRLPYNKNHLTFDFIGMFYRNPDNVFYRHRLKGFEDSFSPPHNQNYVTYSNVSPGKYSFEIIASQDFKTWSKPTILPFTISSPFWARKWFIGLCVFVILSVIYALYGIRSSIRKRKTEAERLGYQTRLLELEQQALNASMNRHFVFNALNSIQYFINIEDKKSANTYLTKFAKLIRKNLDDLQNEYVSLAEEIERIKLYLSLEQMRFEGSFDYTITLSENIDIEKIAIPSMILQPFIENSIIHGILPLQRPGKIDLDVTIQDHIIIFSIQDNGVGFEQTMAQKALQKNTHLSKGMSITKERLNVLKKVSNNEHIDVVGPVELKNEMGHAIGTKVEIKLPFVSVN